MKMMKIITMILLTVMLSLLFCLDYSLQKYKEESLWTNDADTIAIHHWYLNRHSIHWKWDTIINPNSK